MKKIALLTAGVAVLALSSCKKDRNCECVDTDDQYTVMHTILNSTEADAKEACDAWDATYETYSTECELKD